MHRAVGVMVCLLGMSQGTGAPSLGTTTLVGAGGTFPVPLYTRWFAEYEKIHPGWQMRYVAVGSGEGVHQVTTGGVDFGGTDSPMTDREIVEARVKVLHFPAALGAAVPAYNLPDLDKPLNFTGHILAGIFLGTIQKWNDPAIAAINPEATLPAAHIAVVHRLEASGTTYVWTDYLSKVDARWRHQIGRDTEVKWPKGVGFRGNGGVVEAVKRTPNSIGYCELAYALQSGLPYGLVRNAGGNFILASPESITAAADSLRMTRGDFRVSITNPAGRDAYPIASFTWLLVPANMESNKKPVMQEFLRWMLTSGQAFSEPLGYARLPEAAIRMELQAVERIQ